MRILCAVQEVFPGSAPAAKVEEGAEAATERLRQQLLAVGGTLPSAEHTTCLRAGLGWFGDKSDKGARVHG